MLAHHLPVARSMVSVGALASLLEAEYGLSGVSCQLIKGTIRDTYHVTFRDGQYIFSIYRHGQRTIAEITAEIDLLEHLAAHGLLVAPTVRQRNGERVLAFDTPEGMRHGALFTYIEGRHLSRTPEPEPVRRYGYAVARMHRLADMLPEPLSRPQIDATLLLDQALDAIASVLTRRPQDIAYLRDVATILRPRLEALPRESPFYGLIHGDVIPSNAQVTPDGQIALLDLDFCGYGWRAYDVATYLGEARYFRAGVAVAEAFQAGYEEVRPLQGWEKAALADLEAARHIFALSVPAQNVNEWGSAYLDPIVDRMLDLVRRAMVEIVKV